MAAAANVNARAGTESSTGMKLLLALGFIAAIAAIVTGVWFVVEPRDFADHASNLAGIKAVLGAQLVLFGLALAVVGYFLSQKSAPEGLTASGLAGVAEAFAKLLDKGGGLGLAIMLIGALLLGTSV